MRDCPRGYSTDAKPRHITTCVRQGWTLTLPPHSTRRYVRFRAPKAFALPLVVFDLSYQTGDSADGVALSKSQVTLHFLHPLDPASGHTFHPPQPLGVTSPYTLHLTLYTTPFTPHPTLPAPPHSFNSMPLPSAVEGGGRDGQLRARVAGVGWGGLRSPGYLPGPSLRTDRGCRVAGSEGEGGRAAPGRRLSARPHGWRLTRNGASLLPERRELASG